MKPITLVHVETFFNAWWANLAGLVNLLHYQFMVHSDSSGRLELTIRFVPLSFSEVKRRMSCAELYSGNIVSLDKENWVNPLFAKGYPSMCVIEIKTVPSYKNRERAIWKEKVLFWKPSRGCHDHHSCRRYGDSTAT